MLKRLTSIMGLQPEAFILKKHRADEAKRQKIAL